MLTYCIAQYDSMMKRLEVLVDIDSKGICTPHVGTGKDSFAASDLSIVYMHHETRKCLVKTGMCCCDVHTCAHVRCHHLSTHAVSHVCSSIPCHMSSPRFRPPQQIEDSGWTEVCARITIHHLCWCAGCTQDCTCWSVHRVGVCGSIVMDVHVRSVARVVTRHVRHHTSPSLPRSQMCSPPAG